MAIIEIAVGRSKYKIDCPENEKNKLLHLAVKLDERIKTSFNNLQNIDERTLLLITALTLEDELESKSQATIEITNKNIPTEKIDDSDMYAALTENIENIAEYIEKLAKKIENY
ncbi:MAG: cell division protein ZapA [Rickettsiales bacterium]|nr:cell division protein ZapA [Rickettsiales bacterium]